VTTAHIAMTRTYDWFGYSCFNCHRAAHALAIQYFAVLRHLGLHL
jgi:hypothetical protein